MGRNKPGKPKREPRPSPEFAEAMKMPQLVAAIDLIGHSGAKDISIRYCDEEEPVVWMAIATYERVPPQLAAALHPARAALLLCEQLFDGGICLRCNRRSGFEPDSLDTMPMDDLICWFQWDPELKVIRRGCEGDTEREATP
jgi:hypothetical protein